MNNGNPSYNEIDVKLGKHVRALRRARNISQTALAKDLGVTFQQVQKYETGKNRISVSTLLKMQQVLDVPLEVLVPPMIRLVEERQSVTSEIYYYAVKLPVRMQHSLLLLLAQCSELIDVEKATRNVS